MDRQAIETARCRRRDRARLRRELRERDARSARLAELHHMDELLAEAALVVDRGWIQHGWFAYDDSSGVRHVVKTSLVRAVSGRSVSATCLVGAVVHAAGGPSTGRSQLVQRTLDLTWHALYREDKEPVRWCPSPTERAGHVQDLVHWNDSAGRGADDVSSLLVRARELVHKQREQTIAGPGAAALPVQDV